MVRAPGDGSSMKPEDVDITCEAYRAGLVPLKAAALALGIRLKQDGKPLEAKELMKKTGATRSRAFEAAQAVRSFLACQSQIPGLDTYEEVPESRIPGPDSPGKRDSESRNQAPPPHPPIVGISEEERERERRAREIAREDISAAIATLHSHINTGHVADYLGQHGSDPDVVAIGEDGWRWSDAAARFISSEVEHAIKVRPGKTAFAYLRTMARSATAPRPPVLKATGTSGPAPRSNAPRTPEEQAAWREQFVKDLNDL